MVTGADDSGDCPDGDADNDDDDDVEVLGVRAGVLAEVLVTGVLVTAAVADDVDEIATTDAEGNEGLDVDASPGVIIVVVVVTLSGKSKS